MTRLRSLVLTVIYGAALIREQHSTIVDLTAALTESHEREAVLVEASGCKNLSVHLKQANTIRRLQVELGMLRGDDPHKASLRLAP